MAEVDRAAKNVMEGAAHVQSLEDGLKNLDAAIGTLNMASAPLQMLPKVGSAIGKLRRAMKLVKDRAISPAKRKVTTLNNKVKKLGEKACKTSKKTMQLATQMSSATQHYDSIMKTALYVDSVCPGKVPTLNDKCQSAADAHQAVNDRVDAMQKEAKKIQALLKIPGDVFDKVSAFLSNGAYKAFVRFLRKLEPVLKPIKDLLSRRLTVRLPVPVMRSERVCFNFWYPCGVRMCSRRIRWFGTIRWPCGVNWCRKRSCVRVWYPSFEMRSWRFSVGDIVGGVLSLVDWIMAPFQNMIEGLVKQLGVDMSAFLLPRFPSLPSFPALLQVPDLPKLPTLSLTAPLVPQIPSMCRATTTTTIPFITSIGFVQASYKRGSDRGSGAKRDLSLYRPAPSSYASFGDTDSTRAVPAVHVSKVDKAIANGEVSWSIGWQRVWNDENSGNKLDFDVYVPKCPDNFVAIGMVAVFGSKLGHHSLPSKRVLCVNWYHSQLVEGGVTSPNVWSDAGTGSKWDLVVGRLAHGLLWPTHSDMARPPASYNFKKQ